jgi:hypothetical protein
METASSCDEARRLGKPFPDRFFPAPFDEDTIAFGLVAVNNKLN